MSTPKRTLCLGVTILAIDGYYRTLPARHRIERCSSVRGPFVCMSWSRCDSTNTLETREPGHSLGKRRCGDSHGPPHLRDHGNPQSRHQGPPLRNARVDRLTSTGFWPRTSFYYGNRSPAYERPVYLRPVCGGPVNGRPVYGTPVDGKQTAGLYNPSILVSLGRTS